MLSLRMQHVTATMSETSGDLFKGIFQRCNPHEQCRCDTSGFRQDCWGDRNQCRFGRTCWSPTAQGNGGPQLTHLSATKLAHLIASREVSAVEVAEAYLARIAEVNPKLNAIVQLDPQRILAEARQADSELKQGVNRGPLHGVPFTMKDQLQTKGIITTNGCPELKDYVPSEDATVVKR